MQVNFKRYAFNFTLVFNSLIDLIHALTYSHIHL
jgi:hypothetical protein